MLISFVVAAARNNVIGKDGQLPWKLANDMKHFKNVTWGFPVVMGRKTFESLGKALPGRQNIVITRQKGWHANDTKVVNTFEEAIEAVKELDVKEMMVIGGGEIFKMVMPDADQIYLTRVDAVPDGDAFFPPIDESQWELKSREDHPADEKNNFPYSFQLWERVVR